MISLLDSAVAVNEEIDAAIDATDTAHKHGYNDATEGKPQDAALYPEDTPAWYAYHAGYKTGCEHYSMFTGEPREYWEPDAVQPLAVSWASEPTAGVFRCPNCGQYYDPTYPHTCKRRAPADWPTEDEIQMIIGKGYGYA